MHVIQVSPFSFRTNDSSFDNNFCFAEYSHQALALSGIEFCRVSHAEDQDVPNGDLPV